MTESGGTRAIGTKGEELAREYLEHRGLEILEMNYRFGKGEIDIIAADDEYLVFCEVKMRRNDRYGPPEYALTAAKQQQVRRMALAYLSERHIRDQACRFDVVAIDWSRTLPYIHHIPNAF